MIDTGPLLAFDVTQGSDQPKIRFGVPIDPIMGLGCGCGCGGSCATECGCDGGSACSRDPNGWSKHEKPLDDHDERGQNRHTPFTGDWYWGPKGWSGPLGVPDFPLPRIPKPIDPNPEPPRDPPTGRPVPIGPVESCPRPEFFHNERCEPSIPRNYEPLPSFVPPWLNPDAPGYALAVSQSQHQVRVPSEFRRFSEPLFVVLHGKNGNPQDQVAYISIAFQQTCHRVISLQWNADETTSWECGRILAGNNQDAFVSTDDWNDCLVDERTRRLTDPVYGIEAQLVGLLVRLYIDYPDEGWDQYYSNGLPDWEKIVIAGYSEGANEAGFIIRNRPVAGAVLISGGGDRKDFKLPRQIEDVEQARWMRPWLPDNDRVVGMFHGDEEFASSYKDGWRSHGMPNGAAGDASAFPPYYTSFEGKHYLEFQNEGLDPPAAHAKTNDEEWYEAHMYLACRASGKAIT